MRDSECRMWKIRPWVSWFLSTGLLGYEVFEGVNLQLVDEKS